MRISVLRSSPDRSGSCFLLTEAFLFTINESEIRCRASGLALGTPSPPSALRCFVFSAFRVRVLRDMRHVLHGRAVRRQVGMLHSRAAFVLAKAAGCFRQTDELRKSCGGPDARGGCWEPKAWDEKDSRERVLLMQDSVSGSGSAGSYARRIGGAGNESSGELRGLRGDCASRSPTAEDPEGDAALPVGERTVPSPRMSASGCRHPFASACRQPFRTDKPFVSDVRS